MEVVENDSSSSKQSQLKDGTCFGYESNAVEADRLENDVEDSRMNNSFSKIRTRKMVSGY